MPQTIVGIVALLLLLYLSLLNWQGAVKTVLVLVVLEGALRKWALPQATQLVYFLKDIVLLGAYCRYFFFFRPEPKTLPRYPLLVTVLFFCIVWALVQAFNPSLGSPIVGFMGMKNYFFYIPLVWMLPDLFNTEEELYRFLRTYLLLLIPVGLLAIAQFFSPPNSPLNVYAWGDESLTAIVFQTGGNQAAVRVTGTFSFIAGYALYLSVCLCLILPILPLSQPQLWQFATLGELLLIAATSFMTGARGLIIGSVLFVISYLLLQGMTNLGRLVKVLRQFLFPALLGFGLVTWKFQSAVDGLFLRMNSTQDLPDRISGNFTEVVTNFQLKALDGYGTGATFQANPFLRRLLSLPAGETIPVYFESEMGRIALELGPIGFCLWYGLKLLWLFVLWRTYWQLRRPFLRRLALAAFLFSAINFPGQFVYNHTANVFYWFFNGFIFLLPHLEATANWQDYQQASQQYEQTYELPAPVSDSSYE